MQLITTEWRVPQLYIFFTQLENFLLLLLQYFLNEPQVEKFDHWYGHGCTQTATCCSLYIDGEGKLANLNSLQLQFIRAGFKERGSC